MITGMKRNRLHGLPIILNVGLFFFLFCETIFLTSSYAEERPSDVIRKFNSTLLEAMKRADELGYEGRYNLLEPVINDSFAIPFMAGQSAGKYWKDMTEAQRSLYIKTYTEWSTATYAGRFDGYSGEKLEIASQSEPARGTVTVISKLIKRNNEVIEFHYVLRKIENPWRVVDIRISGVSQLAMTRAQFTGILKEKGFNALISMLKEKIRAFSEGKKK